jgi:hypothetical protein
MISIFSLKSQSKLDKAINLQEVIHIKAFLQELKRNYNEKHDLISLLNSLNNENVLSNNVKNQTLFEYKALVDLIPYNDEERKFSEIKNLWAKDFSLDILADLINELNQYIKNELTMDFKDNSLIFNGFFGKISSVLQKINLNTNELSLASVKIFMTYSLEFDADYSIKKDMYKTNAPYLIVISPKIIVNKIILVNLSCLSMPNYPDNKEKANDVYGEGIDGIAGKPGLPGYNGGDFLLLSDSIFNATNLNFKSNGGKGGMGQNGPVKIKIMDR